MDTPTDANAYVAKIGKNLELIREISKKIQGEVKLKYSRGTLDTARVAYKPGEFVFFLLEGKIGVGNKLNSRKKGPYVVISHENDSNVVIVKDLVTNKFLRLNQKDLQLFVGDLENAVRVARLDDDQYQVDEIIGYNGDPVMTLINRRHLKTFVSLTKS